MCWCCRQADASVTAVRAALTFSTRHGECARNFNTPYHTFGRHNRQAVLYTQHSTLSVYIIYTRRGHKDGTKFGAVIIINDGSRALNSSYKRACNPENRTMNREQRRWRISNVTHECMHAFTHRPGLWPLHTRTRETPCPPDTSGSRHRLISGRLTWGSIFAIRCHNKLRDLGWAPCPVFVPFCAQFYAQMWLIGKCDY